MSLLTLFGGVAWDWVVGAYVGTFSITLFAASLAILVSTFARRVRQGVVVAYVLIAAWLIVPPVFDGVCAWLYPEFYRWFEPANEWIQLTGPLGLMTLGRPAGPRGMLMPGARGYSFLELYCWMVGMQLGAAVIFILLAAWRLRPVFRRQEESQPRLTWFAPPCVAALAQSPGMRFGCDVVEGKVFYANGCLHQAHALARDDHPDGLRDPGRAVR